ncbi:MAG: hypothetical protein ABI366_10065 [Ginsengibacter sp.]
MKKIFSITKFCFLLVTCLSFSNCKKNTDKPIDKSNIILYDKPLSVIQECIQGKWELIYAQGWFTGNYIQYYHDEFWEFNNNNISITDSGSVYIDTTIQWKKDPITFNPGQNTYTLNYNDRANYPHKYYVERINNDTLSIVDYGIDGMGYYFTKSN